MSLPHLPSFDNLSSRIKALASSIPILILYLSPYYSIPRRFYKVFVQQFPSSTYYCFIFAFINSEIVSSNSLNFFDFSLSGVTSDFIFFSEDVYMYVEITNLLLRFKIYNIFYSTGILFRDGLLAEWHAESFYIEFF
jgi:hypothetical protein